MSSNVTEDSFGHLCPMMNNDNEMQSEDIEMKGQMLFSVDEAPFPLLWPLLGMQQILISIGSIISLATLTSIQLGVEDQSDIRAQILGISLFGCGIATVLQNIAGTRLPVLHGQNGIFLAPMAAIFSQNAWSDETLLQQIRENNNTLVDEPWKIRMREFQGNLMLATATLFLLGACGIIGLILRFVGPLTVAPTITIAGFYIGQLLIPLCEKHWGIAVMSLVLLLVIDVFLSNIKLPFPTCSRGNGLKIERVPVFQLFPVLLTICITWLLSYILTVTDTLPSNSTLPGHNARTDVRQSAIYEAPWFRFPLPFQFGIPSVSVSGYLAILVTTLAGLIKCTGDFMGTARVAEMVPPPQHAINRGIAILGVSSTLAAMVGDLCPAMPYTQSIGAIAVTKVPSRILFITAGVLMILAGVIGKAGAVFTIIPDPVIGGVAVVALSMVTATGIATLQHVDLASHRNLLTIGTSMMLGLTVPNWMTSHPGAVKTGSKNFDQIVTVLLSNPLFITGFLGCLLDNVLPGTEKERGIKSWRRPTTTSGTQYKTGEDTYELPYLTPLFRKLTCCSYLPISPTFSREITCKSCCSRRSTDTANNPNESSPSEN